MFSFYGGEPGQSFEIKKIFPNKTALDEDIKKKWDSEIMPGEYVLVSYGSYGINNQENKNEYVINHDIDKETYNNKEINYNATLWRKSYYEREAYGQNANYLETKKNNLYQQYDTSSDFYNTYDIESRTYSKDFGLSYELITVLTGNTPLISLNKNINGTGLEVVGPNESPEVNLDNSDINNPKLDFKMPRAAKFYYGTTVDLNDEEIPIPYKTKVVVPKEITIEPEPDPEQEEIIPKIKVGDFYTNINSGNIFILKEIKNDGQKIFLYQANNAPSAPQSIHTIINPYYKKEGENFYNYNYPRINFVKKNNNWEANIETPTMPEMIGEVNYIGPEEKIDNSVIGSILNEKQYKYSFNIPRGPKVFAGDKISNNPNNLNDPSKVPTAKLGDFYINTEVESDSTGRLFQLLEENGEKKWKDQGSVRGPMGQGLKVVDSYTIDKDTTYLDENNIQRTVGEDNLENTIKFLNSKKIDISADEIIVITYQYEAESATIAQIKDQINIHDQDKGAHSGRGWISSKDKEILQSDSQLKEVKKINNQLKQQSNSTIKNTKIGESQDKSYVFDRNYWYYQLKNSEGIKEWHRICITSGLYTVLKDSYVQDYEEGKVYSTKYINTITRSINKLEQEFKTITSYWQTF